MLVLTNDDVAQVPTMRRLHDDLGRVPGAGHRTRSGGPRQRRAAALRRHSRQRQRVRHMLFDVQRGPFLSMRFPQPVRLCQIGDPRRIACGHLVVRRFGTALLAPLLGLVHGDGAAGAPRQTRQFG